MSDAPLLVSVPDVELADALGDLPAGVVVVHWPMTSPAPHSHIDIVVPPYMTSPRVLSRLSEVSTRLVQSQAIGFEGVADSLPAGHVFANAAGVHEASTGELAIALILASQRGIPDFVRDAQRGRWVRSERASLADRTVLIVGVGGVGRAVLDRLVAFETTVTRVARRARRDERGEVHGLDELHDLLARADIVVVAVPLTNETVNLVDASFLASMSDGSLLVNVARGAVADTDALVDEAATGRLRLALDVTNPEPLPDGHLLFALDNVLITPHVGGATSAMLPRMARLLRDQIERMIRGDEPRNVVVRTTSDGAGGSS